MKNFTLNFMAAAASLQPDFIKNPGLRTMTIKPACRALLHITLLLMLLVCSSALAWGTTYYSKETGYANLPATWGTNTDGTGTAPGNFTTSGDLFVLRSQSALIFNNNWTIGAGVTLKVDGKFTLAAPDYTQYTVLIEGTIIFTSPNSSQAIISTTSGNTYTKNTFTLGPNCNVITANAIGLVGDMGRSISTYNVGKAVITIPSTADYEFNGETQSTLGLPTTVRNLTLSGSGSKTIPLPKVINGNFSINGPVKAVLHSTANTAYALIINGNKQIAGSWGSSISPATNINDTYFGATGYITIITSCTNPTSGGTITGAQNICAGDKPEALTSSVLPDGHDGTLEYKWQYSTSSVSGPWTDIASVNSPSCDAPALTSTTWFRRLVRVDCSGNWEGAAESNVVEVTVYSLPEAPAAVNNTITYDGTAKSASASVDIDEVVDWYSDATGPATATAPTGNNAGTYTAWAEARNPSTGCVSETRTQVTLTIEKATPAAALTINNPQVIYSGNQQTAIVVISESLVPGTVVNVSNDTHTDAGTYAVTADFVPADSDNYNTLTGAPAGVFTISPRPLNIEFTAGNKCYDGTVHADLSSINPAGGVISDDVISIEYLNVEFANAGPGTGIPVTLSGLYLTGADEGNYELTSPTATTTANIETIPVAGTLTKTPDAAGVVENYTVSAVLIAGSGGNGTDELQYSTDGGNLWLPYIPGTDISTTGLSEVQVRTRRKGGLCDDSDYNTVKWTVISALQYVIDNTTLTGDLLDLTATFPVDIPQEIIDDDYKINSRITLTEALPAGTTISIMISVNGSPAIPYVTSAEVPGQTFWITDLFNPVQSPSDFDGIYGGRTENYSVSINNSEGNSLKLNGPVKIESIISKDHFTTGSLVVLDENWFLQNGLPTAVISGTKSVCTGGSATLSVALTGRAPWSISLSDGTIVNDIQASPYTFTVNPTANSTWSIISVTDRNGVTNTGTGEAKIYHGPITTAPQVFACPNTAIEVPITVKSFSEVRDISLTIKYDPGVMTYTGFVNGGVTFNSPDPAIQGSIGEVHDMPYNGSRVIVISKLSESNLQLDDDAVLLTLKFNYISGNTDLEWVDSPDESWCSYSYQDILDGSVDGRKWFCDVPSDKYYLNGSVTTSPEPHANIVFNGTVAGYGDIFAYCYSDNIEVTLQHIEGLAPFDVEWTVNGTEHSATLNDGDALFNGIMPAGTYHVQITSLTDARGCVVADASTYSATAVVSEEPDVNILFNGNVAGYGDTFTYCYNENIVVTLEALKGTAPYSIKWIVGGGAEQSATLESGGELFNGKMPAGIYEVQLTSVTDYKGCKLADATPYTATVIVSEEPDVNILFNGTVAGYGDTFTYCYNENLVVTLEALKGTAPYTVKWTVGDGAEQSATLESGGELFNGKMPAGIYEVQLTSVTDYKGCVLADATPYTATVVVSEEPDVNILFNGIVAGYGDTFTYCYNENMVVTVGALKGTAPYTVKWTIGGGAEQSATLEDGGELFNGTMPAGIYEVQLTSVTDYNGCALSDATPYTATVVVNKEPDVFFTIDNTPLMPEAEKEYCYDVENLHLALVNSQEGQAAVGTAPFDLTFKINGGNPVALTDLEYDEAINLVTYLPEGPNAGQAAVGNYLVQVTELSDATGCRLSVDALNYYSFTLTINPEPSVSVTPASVTCSASATGSVTMLPADMSRTYIYILEGVSSGEKIGVYTFTGLTAGDYYWTMTDAITSCFTSGTVTVDEPAAISLTGTVKYYNTAGTSLDGVSVKLLNEGTTNEVAFTTTDIYGAYSFYNVCPGIYDVVISTAKPMRSINSTDAGQVNAWNVSQSDGAWSTVEKVRFLAGDVNGDNQIHALDAGMIQNYFLTLGTGVTFDKPWEFWKTDDVISVQPQPDNILKIEIHPGSTDMKLDFYGLVSGDFDRSNVPAAGSTGILTVKNAQTEEGSVTLQRGNELNVNTNEVVELPVRATSSMQVGAISLILDYPAEQLRVEEVFLKDNPAQAAGFNIVNGMLVIGWNSLDPLSVEAGEPLVTIRVRMTGDASDLPVFFSLTSNPLNELADENMIAIDNASLVMDGFILKGSVTGTDVQEKTPMLLTCSPNPFNDRAAIRYTLPSDGHVNLDVTGLPGNRMNILSNRQQIAGEYHIDLEGSNLVTGVYNVVLRFTDKSGQHHTTAVKMIKR